MDIADREMRRALMEAAARLPQLAEGGSIKAPVYRLQQRNDGCWRWFENGKYGGTTGCKEEADARLWLATFKLQRNAEEDGLFDVRRVSVTAVIEHRTKIMERRKKQAETKKKQRGPQVVISTLRAIEGHVEGLQLRHLSDEKIDEIGEAMFAEGRSYEYFCNATRFLATAIRQYTKKTFGAKFLPFDPPPCPKGRTVVVSDAQRDRVKRWALGEEAYDPQTGLWTRQKGLSDAARRDRQVAYRELYLGLTFGSRPGAYEKLSWEQNDEGGWLDLDGGVFHRVPPGMATAPNKLAPPVAMPPDVVAELRRWKEADGGSPWVFRTLKGGPLSQSQQQQIFKKAMLALGISKVTGHVLRHSCISKMIEKGASAPSISAICGISIRMLYGRYGHFENRLVQILAHGVMTSMMH